MADMKLESAKDDPTTGLRYDVRYGENEFDPKTGLRFDTRYGADDVDPETGLRFDRKYGNSSPFDDLSPQQHKMLDKAVKVADGIKLYKSAGGAGVGSQWAPFAHELAQRGGLAENEALMLARYRMWKDGMQVPKERQPDLTDEQKGARREEFVNGDSKVRSRLMDEDKAAIANGHQGYFDSLVAPKQVVQSFPPAGIARPGVAVAPSSAAMAPPPAIADPGMQMPDAAQFDEYGLPKRGGTV